LINSNILRCGSVNALIQEERYTKILDEPIIVMNAGSIN
jgi:hypothetical protein